MRGFDGERPTDRPELADVEVTRPRQPSDVLSETDGRIYRCTYAPRSRIVMVVGYGAVHKVCHAPRGRGSEKV